MSTQPQTEVDERFSDPGTTATAWAEAREQLEQAQLSWITTVRADGRPHVTPLVAVRVTDDALLRRLAVEWANKWDRRWRFEARHGVFHDQGEGEALVFAVVPTKVLAFGKEAVHPHPTPLLSYTTPTVDLSVV